MRKRLTGTLAVLACILALTACSGTASTQQQEIPEETRNALFSLTETTAQQMDEVVNAGLVEEQSSNAVIYTGLQGWSTAKQEMGAVDFTADADGNGVADCFEEKTITIDDDGNYIVTVGVTGEAKSADFVATFNSDITDYVSFATNINYSFAELMQQAGLNTLLGMGTTFAVLILLSLIIALFGNILTSTAKKRAEEKARKEEEEEKKRAEEAAASRSSASEEEAPAAAAAEQAAVQDDGQLIAVITAAVAAFRAEEEAGQGSLPVMPADPDAFVVRKIRRIRRK